MDKRLIWLAVGSFAMSTVGFVFASLLPSIAADTHTTIPMAGYLMMTFSLAYAVGAPVLSAVAGEIDRRRVLTVAMLSFVAGNLIAASSSSFSALLAAQIVMGMSAGLFAATAQATAVSLAGPEHRARAISVVVGGTTFAVALGAPLGSLIATFWGWRGTFLSDRAAWHHLRGDPVGAATARPAGREADARRTLRHGQPARRAASARHHAALPDRRLHHHLLSGAARHRWRRPAGAGASRHAVRASASAR